MVMVRKILALAAMIAVLSGSVAFAQLLFSDGLRFDYVHDNHPDRAPLLATDLGGIYMSAAPTVSGNTLTINYQDSAGDPASLDFIVTPSLTNTHLSTATWDLATRTITLTLSDSTTETVTLTGLLSEVSTSGAISGDGSPGDPVTIAANAITRDSLSSEITDTLDRADNVPFALTYQINNSATAVDGQSTYWIGNIYEAHLDMTVHAFQVETLVPTGQDRTYRGTLVPLTQVSAASYTADSNPLQVVIREPGRTFGTQAVITGNGTQRTLEVQASGREFHVNEGGYFFLGVGISNAIDATYVLAASGSTEEDHADHTGFSFDVMTYVAKGSNNEGSRTQLSGTEFFNSTTTAIRMEVHYDAAPGGLQDGVTTSAVCTGNDLVLGRSQGLLNLTAPGACQAGLGGTVTTSAPVSGDGSAGDPVTISDGAIDADALGIDSVNAAEIAGSAVRNEELANNAVSSAKIADGAVTLGKLGNGAVATNHIVDGSVTSAKIADATIANADMANNSIDGSNLRPNSVGSSEIESGAVGTSELDDDSVTVAKMNSGSAADGTIATADGSGGVAFEAGGGGTVSTSAPVSGDGTSGNPVTIADGAIDREYLSTNVQQDLARGTRVYSGLLYEIDDDARTNDSQSTRWLCNIYQGHRDLTVSGWEWSARIPVNNHFRWFKATGFLVTQHGPEDYRPTSSVPFWRVRNISSGGAYEDIVGLGRGPTNIVHYGAEAPDDGMHVEENGYFAQCVWLSGIDANDQNFENPDNVTDVLYLLGASGATEVDHVNHPDFAHNFIDFIAKGSRDHEMNSTTNFWRSTGYSLTQRIHYDVLEGALGDGVLESGTCSGDDSGSLAHGELEPRHRAGRLRWGAVVAPSRPPRR